MNIKTQDGIIIRARNSGKMFLMSHGRRRWILTMEAAEQFNLDLSHYQEYSDMAVPDKRYTFDKPRALTKVKHIMEDYECGVTAERDLEHVHCCKKIWVGSGYKMIWDMSEDEIKEYLNKDMIDIHWHTYTDRSFRQLLKKVTRKTPWTSTTIIPIKRFTQRKNFIEFYVVLKK